jgi:oligopeptide transport system substrate-binding protein
LRIAAAAGSLTVAVAVLLTGCTAPGGSADDVIRATGTEPTAPLIPANTVEPGGARVIDSIFAGLVTYDPDGTAVNDMADTIEVSTDKTVITVELRSASFTNGNPVDANSFVNAWDWAADSANAAPDQSFFSDIKGYTADDPETPEVERSSLLEKGGLVVLGASSFEIHLRGPLADYPQRFGQRAFFPLPAVFFDDPAAFGRHPVGNGPYMLDGPEAWHHGEGIDLVTNPDYDGPRVPQNDGVSLRFYDDPEMAYVDVLSGFLDVIDILPASALPHYDDELGANAYEGPGTTLQRLVIPAKLKHFTGSEGLLRRSAISMAIDRDAITLNVFGGRRLSAHDFTSPVVAGYSDVIPGAEVLSFDPDAALSRWSEADELKKKSAGPWEGTLQIAYAADSGDETWVAAVVDGLRVALGIDVAAVPFPTQADLDAAVADGSIGMPFVSSQTAQYPGMLSFLGSYVTKAPGNVGGYTSKDFDAAMKSAALAGSPDEVVESFTDAQRILFFDLPAVPLWYSTRQAGAGDKVSKPTLDWDGVPRYFEFTRRP